MIAVPCKAMCPNCGYREDCSDIFPAARGETPPPASAASRPPAGVETLFPMGQPPPAAPAPRPARAKRIRPLPPTTGWLFPELN